jgi:hypothetical protein
LKPKKPNQTEPKPKKTGKKSSQTRKNRAKPKKPSQTDLNRFCPKKPNRSVLKKIGLLIFFDKNQTEPNQK